MGIVIRGYEPGDLPGMRAIWNFVVEGGMAFPQEEPLTEDEAVGFFGSQSHCGVAVLDGRVVGLYILHPNNVGRCGHICNASYAVRAAARGKGVGELLVRDCIVQARQLGFRILQFNAVVKTNTAARRLYQKLGFAELGEIPGGFHMPDGRYESIIPYYLPLTGEKQLISPCVSKRLRH